ncbi:PFL family protein [Numidum massiliense]|uniref:PFL family protein n=1 Tax=Numidum massiliense TaxID=1522315 RepID=UPI0006D5765C|nr:PFL family protein [Numidum massiliense]
MTYNMKEVTETLRMIHDENLDIRTVTMGISLEDCADQRLHVVQENIANKIKSYAKNLTTVVEQVEREFGIPIINKRLAVTPIAKLAGPFSVEECVQLARVLDETAADLGVDFIGGYSALVHKGFHRGDRTLISSLPTALAETSRLCASISVASTKAGINMDAIYEMGQVIKQLAHNTRDTRSLGCAKLVVFCNPVEDNPFMAGAFHGAGEPECVINVGVSGPGVVLNAIKKDPDVDLGTLANTIKHTVFKITRMGELVGRITAERLGVPFGIVDLSLAPTNAVGDSVADIIEAMGLEKCGTHGTTAALALMNDAVKKGGAMATSHAGGLSGAFIPVSEDNGMIAAVGAGALSLDKLEAMTCVCSVGLDMVAVPGNTPAETIAALIADEAAIGMINKKTTGVRIIPVAGAKEGDMVEFGGLLGRAPVMPVHPFSSAHFVGRGGRIPAPIQALTN